MRRLLEFSLDKAALRFMDVLGEETETRIFSYSNRFARDTERRIKAEEYEVKNCISMKEQVYLVTLKTYADNSKGKTTASDLLRYFQSKSVCTLLCNESHDLSTTMTSPACQLR